MKKFCLVLVFWLLVSTVAANAQGLEFSSHTEFQLVEDRFRDQPGSGAFTGFAPTLNVSYLSPVRPGADLYLDTELGFSQNVFRLSRQTNDNLRLIFRGEDPRYRLSLRLGKSHFHSASSGSGLEAIRLNSTTTETGFTATLREPSYPLVNLQWLRFTTDSGASDVHNPTTSTTSRIAALYDLEPLHFRFDESRRKTDSRQGSDSQALSRRLGVSFDTPLLSRLNLFGDLQFSRSESQFGTQAKNERGERLALLRLSAFPTSSVAIDTEYLSQISEGLSGNSRSSDFSTSGLAVRVRSEVWPGIQLNLSREGQRSARDRTIETTTDFADLLAQVDDRNSALVSFSRRQVNGGSDLSEQQNSQRFSWVSQLDSQTDATLSWDNVTSQEAATGDSRTSNVNVALRYRPDLQTSIGLGYLTSNSTFTRPEGNSRQGLQAYDFDFSWLPTQDLSLGGRLSVSQLSGSSQAKFLVPSFDFRWQPDSRTDIGVNWRLQRTRQQDTTGSSSFDLTLSSGRLRHRLSSYSDLDIGYDIIQASQGSLALERVLRLIFTTHW